MESAQAKNQALREAGAVVPDSYEALESAIKQTFDKLVSFVFLIFNLNYCLLFFCMYFDLQVFSLVFNLLYSSPCGSLKRERSHQ